MEKYWQKSFHFHSPLYFNDEMIFMKQLKSSKKYKNTNVDNQIWKIKFTVSGGVISQSLINWLEMDINARNKSIMQDLLMGLWSLDEVPEYIELKENEFRKVRTLNKFILVFEEYWPDTLISQLSKQELIDVVVQTLFYKRSTASSDMLNNLEKVSKPLSRQDMERTLTLLSSWFALAQLGEVNDGPSYLLTIPNVERSVKIIFKNKQLNFHDWIDGGTFGSIPFVIAHLLLADAISLIESVKTKQVLTFFETVENTNSYHLVPSFWAGTPSTRIGKYRRTGDIDFLKPSAASEFCGGLANDTKLIFAIPLHNNLLKITSNSNDSAFPWRTYSEFFKDVSNIRTAVFIIFISVMGRRGPSEVRTLTTGDFTLSADNNNNGTLYRPSIEKTHSGFKQEQGVTNSIENAYHVIKRLSYIQKNKDDMHIFSTLPKLNSQLLEVKLLNTSTLNDNINAYYSSFIDRSKNNVNFDIRAIHPKISTHQFRHSYAEFALRKNDLSVQENLRQIFCHKFNNNWLKKYDYDKLDAKSEQEANKSYIRELIPRILRDKTELPDFVGPISVYIKKHFGSLTTILTPEELEVQIELLTDETISITPHEYGWCLLNKKFQSKAKCADKNGKPNPKNTSSSKCNQCHNFCASRQSHLEKQTQIVILHSDFIEQNIWKMPAMMKASKKAIADAKALFPELTKL